VSAPIPAAPEVNAYVPRTDRFDAPSVSSSSSTFVDPVTGIPLSERDIRSREEQLERQEREIADKERQLANGTAQRQTRKNFPPYLKIWEYHPDDDLPEKSRGLAKKLFWVFLGTGICYLLNVVGAFSLFGAGDAAKTSTGMAVILSLVFLCILYPASYEVSYFVLYKAMATGKGLRFFCGFITYAIWWGLLAFCMIGVSDGPSVGFIIMINLFSGGKSGQGFLSLLFCIATVAMVGVMGFEGIMLWRFYKSEGLSNKAYSEAAGIAVRQAYEQRETLIPQESV
jgi:hypothetical protein